MPFPKTDRVLYEKNPLHRVICQLRFPRILKIDSDLPSDFQDHIRDEYPLFTEKRKGQPELPRELIGQLPDELVNLISPSESRKVYEFSSPDENWIVTLSSDSLALTAREYKRWEEFADHFQTSLNAFNRIYSTRFYSRVGLRYQNVIRRTSLELQGAPWSTVLKPYIAGILSAGDSIYQSVKGTIDTTEIELSDGNSLVRIRHGLIDSAGEICYLIDNDFFTTQRTEAGNEFDRLNYFNQRSGRLFRWCIERGLHEKMAPRAI